jgi:hypothetical protein
VVREVHSQLVVADALVLREGVSQDSDNVLELADESLDLGRRELAGDQFAAELPFEPPAFPLDLADPGRDDGDVGVLFEELPVAGEVGVAFLELSAPVEFAALIVLGFHRGLVWSSLATPSHTAWTDGWMDTLDRGRLRMR